MRKTFGIRQVGKAASLETTSMGPVASENVSNNRWAQRKACAIPGVVMIHGFDPIPCVIRNTSATGALVELTHLAESTRTLLSRPHGGMSLFFASNVSPSTVPCTVVWYSDTQLGLRYVGPFKSEGPMSKRRALAA